MNAATYTTNSIRLHRALGSASKRRRVPRQASFNPLIRDYQKFMIGLNQLTKTILASFLASLPAMMESVRSERRFAEMSIYHDAGETQRVKFAMEQARKALELQLRPTALENIAAEFAAKTSTFNKIQLGRQIKAALGIDLFTNDPNLAARMQAFVAENVSQIKSVPESLLGRVEKTVYKAISKGATAQELADELDDQFAIGDRKAAMIARDQIGSFYGQLNATRQQALGIKHFIWRTVHDKRVRDEHAAREEASDPKLGGTPYSYDDPPDGELPGEPINCRCHAEPVFSDILETV